MTTMTLTTAPPVRRTAPRRRPTWEPIGVRGCAGTDQTGAGRTGAAPRAFDRPTRSAAVGVAPLQTASSRLTRRGRVAVVLGFLAVVGGGAVVGQATVAVPSAPTSYGVVTVEPGQTLWGIALQVAPDVDPRATVERLVAVNGLVDADAITAGDQLTVPLSR
jgi:nucleoid-associated protein YgaU